MRRSPVGNLYVNRPTVGALSGASRPALLAPVRHRPQVGGEGHLVGVPRAAGRRDPAGLTGPRQPCPWPVPPHVRPESARAAASRSARPDRRAHHDRRPPGRRPPAAAARDRGGMGISRPTLREALKLLTGAGAIEVRSRSGGMVVSSDPIPVEAIADRRQACSCGGQRARGAARRGVHDRPHRRGRGDRRGPRRARPDDRAPARRRRRRRRHPQLDERFHLTLARGTRNPIDSELARTILRRLTVIRDMTPRRPGDTEHQIAIHAHTLDALRSRDLATVDAAMDEHCAPSRTCGSRRWVGRCGGASPAVSFRT